MFSPEVCATFWKGHTMTAEYIHPIPSEYDTSSASFTYLTADFSFEKELIISFLLQYKQCKAKNSSMKVAIPLRQALFMHFMMFYKGV